MRFLGFLETSDAIANIDVLPEGPAVYAWFKRLDLDCSDEVRFVESVRDLIAGESWPIQMQAGHGQSGPYLARIELTPNPRPFKEGKSQIAHNIGTDERLRSKFANMLVEASILQPPLYIGRATNLRNRIRQHLSGATDFAQLLLGKTSFNSTVLAYVVIDDGFPANTAELLEMVLGTECLPRYAKRVG